MLDVDALLAPVAGTTPVGENTEYTRLGDLVRLAAGHPGVLDPQTQEWVGAEEPDWRKVRAAAVDLLGESKDIRATVILTQAELALHGLPGMGQGLMLTSRMLTQYWDEVYPQLDRDEDNDPIERLNALANLADPDRFIPALRRASILESRQVGRFTVRDLDYALGRLMPPSGEEAPSLTILHAAWNSGDAGENSARQQGVEEGLGAIAAIEQLFREKAGQMPNLDALRLTLKRIKELYDAQQDSGGAQTGLGTASSDSAAFAGSLQASGSPVLVGGLEKSVGTLTSRADAVRTLLQVADFLRKTEPSSPVPMFLDRAVKLLQMDFAAIVRELMPDSRERIELLGGISLEPPVDDDGS